MAWDDIPPADHQQTVEELKKNIVYGAEIGYPHEWSEVAAYLPRLTAQHLTPEKLRACIRWGHLWNYDDPAIKKASAAVPKKKKSQIRVFLPLLQCLGEFAGFLKGVREVRFMFGALRPFALFADIVPAFPVAPTGGFD